MKIDRITPFCNLFMERPSYVFCGCAGSAYDLIRQLANCIMQNINSTVKNCSAETWTNLAIKGDFCCSITLLFYVSAL